MIVTRTRMIEVRLVLIRTGKDGRRRHRRGAKEQKEEDSALHLRREIKRSRTMWTIQKAKGKRQVL